MKNLLFIFILLFNTIHFSQTSANNSENEKFFIVDSIKISGNDITEEFIILREMDFSAGDTISVSSLNYNEERIYSLGIFNFVEVKREVDSTYSNVLIHVDETWYIYPIPFYRLENEKARYGIRVVWKNFRGRNEKLSAMVSFGYNPYYLFTYQNPLISQTHDLSFEISSLYQRVSNPSRKILKQIPHDFEYKFISNSVSFGKRFSPFESIGASFGYTYVESPEYFGNNITASGERIDRYPFVGVAYLYDTRDLKQYAFVGTYFLSSVIYKGFGRENISHSIINLDFRYFTPVVGNFANKVRVASRLTMGKSIPVYDYSYLGHLEYIRGHKDDIREGFNRFIVSYELDYPILKEWELQLDLPLLPKRLTASRIGIHLTAFADAGVVFDEMESIKNSRFDKGWGFGINLLFLPHNGLRFEYAFNEVGKGEFIIGTGLSF